ncbi:MAG: ferritin [Verrucomicrobia bacterium]|nr:ferritin [Verrucomicrobiota bacterium]
MLSEKMRGELNAQINEEYYSAYLYLSMSAYCQDMGLPGFANWFRRQYEEEVVHALKILDYVAGRGARVELRAIAEPAKDFGEPVDLFEASLRHERHITGCIHALVDLALEEKDHATHAMLQWFVNEQVEEESSAGEILTKLKFAGDNKGALLMIDRDLSQRQAGAEEGE